MKSPERVVAEDPLSRGGHTQHTHTHQPNPSKEAASAMNASSRTVVVWCTECVPRFVCVAVVGQPRQLRSCRPFKPRAREPRSKRESALETGLTCGVLCQGLHVSHCDETACCFEIPPSYPLLYGLTQLPGLSRISARTGCTGLLDIVF